MSVNFFSFKLFNNHNLILLLLLFLLFIKLSATTTAAVSTTINNNNNTTNNYIQLLSIKVVDNKNVIDNLNNDDYDENKSFLKLSISEVKKNVLSKQEKPIEAAFSSINFDNYDDGDIPEYETDEEELGFFNISAGN